MSVRISCNNETGFYVNRNNINNAYFTDIRRLPVLSREEEYELLKTYNTSSSQKERDEAKRKLVEGNLRFVVSIAKKLGTSETFMDLVSEGNMGLIRAIEKYDMSRKCHLISYAVNWIVAYIKNYQIMNGLAVVPPNALKLFTYVKAATRELIKETERNPTQEEIVKRVKDKYNFNITNLEDVELGRVISIDEKYSNTDDDVTVSDTTLYNAKTSTNNVQDYIDEEHKKSQVEYFLQKLTEREKYIIQRHFGIGCDAESFDTISMSLNIGKERIRQICTEALSKMRKHTSKK